MAKTVYYGNQECLVVSKSFIDRQYKRPGLYTGEVSFIQDEDNEDLWHTIYHCYTDVDDEGLWYATNCDAYGVEEDW
jgi:hypothetical protein